MRAFFRTLINFGLGLAAVVTDVHLTSLNAYQHASRHGRIVMLVVPAAVAFVIACVLLYLVPSKAQLNRRKKSGQSSPYAATAKGR